MHISKKIAGVLLALGILGTLTGCPDDAQVASKNLSKAADNFEIIRNVVFYNGITGQYMLQVQGRCSIYDDGNQLELTCKEGPNAYSKHFLGLSDNVTYFSEQVETADVSVYHTRITWKPQSVIPDVDFRGDAGDLGHRDTSD